MMPSRYITSPLRAEHGFTLIELLVAMSMGIVVVFAAFTLLVVTLNQSTRVTDKVQVNQVGRTAMSEIMGELHSTCLAREFVPVQSKSTPTELWFVNAYSAEPVINSVKPEPEAALHEIVWNKTSETLTDYSYPSNAGTLPKEFTFASTATPTSGTILATHVTQTGTTPIFTYYKYKSSLNATTTTTGISNLEPLALASESSKLETASKEASSVLVSFTVAPEDKNTEKGRAVSFSDQATFSIGLLAEGATPSVPCQ